MDSTSVSGTEEGTIRCRIQYINDLDPFLQSTNSLTREPMKPLLYPMNLHTPVGEQLPDIIRQLKAPQKPGDAALQLSPTASGDLGSLLDSDLSLSEQPDELQVLQNDP
ncbi:FH1/FH2 domain-containing protein 3 [Ditylenchus destructor]|uniref:FH1/FH2 domain-containing protein 3 n=1 Tax=Ditylenchus destructor TaxID=166010 RepID=A0AAD4MMY2_9BILA|nr:FH1/FH2 domain-containing protein 3 [Ditylenchus destructor]